MVEDEATNAKITTCELIEPQDTDHHIQYLLSQLDAIPALHAAPLIQQEETQNILELVSGFLDSQLLAWGVFFEEVEIQKPAL